jgi:hypothetical protein
VAGKIWFTEHPLEAKYISVFLLTTTPTQANTFVFLLTIIPTQDRCTVSPWTCHKWSDVAVRAAQKEKKN